MYIARIFASFFVSGAHGPVGDGRTGFAAFQPLSTLLVRQNGNVHFPQNVGVTPTCVDYYVTSINYY